MAPTQRRKYLSFRSNRPKTGKMLSVSQNKLLLAICLFLCKFVFKELRVDEHLQPSITQLTVSQKLNKLQAKIYLAAKYGTPILPLTNPGQAGE